MQIYSTSKDKRHMFYSLYVRFKVGTGLVVQCAGWLWILRPSTNNTASRIALVLTQVQYPNLTGLTTGRFNQASSLLVSDVRCFV